MLIRILTPEDAAQYREVRLAALRDHPLAYCTDFSEESKLSLPEFEKRLAPSEDKVSFGAFSDSALVGTTTLLRPPAIRMRFRTTIVAMYVAPSYRGQVIAQALLSAAVDHSRAWTGVEDVCLCITVGNDCARRVYTEFGFQHLSIDPRYFKYQDQYYDLEWLRLPLKSRDSEVPPQTL